MDISHDGKLDFDEMHALLSMGNPNLSSLDLWTIFKEADKDHDGVVDFDEFFDYLHQEHDGDPDTCPANGNKHHQWKFGKCHFCGVAEIRVEHGHHINRDHRDHEDERGHHLNPGASPLSACELGGKCTFKFATCTKCGKSEFSRRH